MEVPCNLMLVRLLVADLLKEVGLRPIGGASGHPAEEE